MMEMMSSRLMLPIRGRDVAAGMLVWAGLVLIAAGWPGRAAGPVVGAGVAIVLGLAAIGAALAYVMPYGRPWPLVQWRAWRQRRHMAFAMRRPLGLLIPSLTRSAFGLVIGEWLGARLLDRLLGGGVTAAELPTVGGLLVAAVLAVTVVLDG